MRWLVLSFVAATALVAVFSQFALWLPVRRANDRLSRPAICRRVAP